LVGRLPAIANRLAQGVGDLLAHGEA
jgi:hypothetical protein